MVVCPGKVSLGCVIVNVFQQFDALIELLTGREMLTMYARLRGVPDNKIKDLVSHAIEILHLEKWADSLCGNYRYICLHCYPFRQLGS